MANNVKLILLQDVDNLGLAGTEVTVAAGYARNYLIPRGYAAKATPGVLRVLAANKEKIEAKRRDELVAAQALAGKLLEANVEIAMQASDDNQLFGSVTARNIADALTKVGFQIAHTRIVIEETIKSVGEFTVQVKLHHDVIADLNEDLAADGAILQEQPLSKNRRNSLKHKDFSHFGKTFKNCHPAITQEQQEAFLAKFSLIY